LTAFGAKRTFVYSGHIDCPSWLLPKTIRDAAIGKPSYLRVAERQSLLEKSQYFIAGCDRRLANFVY